MNKNIIEKALVFALQELRALPFPPPPGSPMDKYLRQAFSANPNQHTQADILNESASRGVLLPLPLLVYGDALKKALKYIALSEQEMSATFLPNWAYLEKVGLETYMKDLIASYVSSGGLGWDDAPDNQIDLGLAQAIAEEMADAQSEDCHVLKLSDGILPAGADDSDADTAVSDSGISLNTPALPNNAAQQGNLPATQQQASPKGLFPTVAAALFNVKKTFANRRINWASTDPQSPWSYKVTPSDVLAHLMSDNYGRNVLLSPPGTIYYNPRDREIAASGDTSYEDKEAGILIEMVSPEEFASRVAQFLSQPNKYEQETIINGINALYAFFGINSPEKTRQFQKAIPEFQPNRDVSIALFRNGITELPKDKILEALSGQFAISKRKLKNIKQNQNIYTEMTKSVLNIFEKRKAFYKNQGYNNLDAKKRAIKDVANALVPFARYHRDVAVRLRKYITTHSSILPFVTRQQQKTLKAILNKSLRWAKQKKNKEKLPPRSPAFIRTASQYLSHKNFIQRWERALEKERPSVIADASRALESRFRGTPGSLVADTFGRHVVRSIWTNDKVRPFTPVVSGNVLAGLQTAHVAHEGLKNIAAQNALTFTQMTGIASPLNRLTAKERALATNDKSGAQNTSIDTRLANLSDDKHALQLLRRQQAAALTTQDNIILPEVVSGTPILSPTGRHGDIPQEFAEELSRITAKTMLLDGSEQEYLNFINEVPDNVLLTLAAPYSDISAAKIRNEIMQNFPMALEIRKFAVKELAKRLKVFIKSQGIDMVIIPEDMIITFPGTPLKDFRSVPAFSRLLATQPGGMMVGSYVFTDSGASVTMDFSTEILHGNGDQMTIAWNAKNLGLHSGDTTDVNRAEIIRFPLTPDTVYLGNIMMYSGSWSDANISMFASASLPSKLQNGMPAHQVAKLIQAGDVAFETVFRTAHRAAFPFILKSYVQGADDSLFSKFPWVTNDKTTAVIPSEALADVSNPDNYTHKQKIYGELIMGGIQGHLLPMHTGINTLSEWAHIAQWSLPSNVTPARLVTEIYSKLADSSITMDEILQEIIKEDNKNAPLIISLPTTQQTPALSGKKNVLDLRPNQLTNEKMTLLRNQNR